jgi:hypothetical protein
MVAFVHTRWVLLLHIRLASGPWKSRNRTEKLRKQWDTVTCGHDMCAGTWRWLDFPGAFLRSVLERTSSASGMCACALLMLVCVCLGSCLEVIPAQSKIYVYKSNPRKEDCKLLSCKSLELCDTNVAPCIFSVCINKALLRPFCCLITSTILIDPGIKYLHTSKSSVMLLWSPYGIHRYQEMRVEFGYGVAVPDWLYQHTIYNFIV